MVKQICLIAALATTAACTSMHTAKDSNAPKQCYTESGWIDSSNGCSERAGFPDCYLVCPDQGTRRKL